MASTSKGEQWCLWPLKALAHPILQHVIPAVQPLHVLFSCFLIFVMISLIENTVVGVLLYHVDRKPLQFPLIVHYLYMSCGASTKTIYVFWRLWSMVSNLLEKHNFIYLSNAPIFIYKRCGTRESLWRGAPVPYVCWYMYLQTSSQANIVSRPHILPMSVWYDFHWHHLLRNRCMKHRVVAMQKTCSLATGDTVCWS